MVIQKGHLRPFLCQFISRGSFDDLNPRTPGRDGGVDPGRLLEEISFDGVGGFFPAGDGPNHGGRTGYRISRRKNTIKRGIHGHIVGLDGVPPGPFQLGQVVHDNRVDSLPHCTDHGIDFHGKFAVLYGPGSLPPAALHRHQFCLDELHRLDAVILPDDFCGDHEKVQLHPLLFRLLDLLFICGHLLPAPAIDEDHLFATQADAGPCGIDGHVPAADHNDPLTGFLPIPQGHLPQKTHRGVDLGKIVFPFHPHGTALVGPYGEEKGLEALSAELVHVDPPPEPGVELKFDPQPPDHRNFLLNHAMGQPVSWDPHQQHAAGLWQRFDHPDLKPFQRQIVGGRQTGRTGSHDTNLAVSGRQVLRITIGTGRHGRFGSECL